MLNMSEQRVDEQHFVEQYEQYITSVYKCVDYSEYMIYEVSIRFNVAVMACRYISIDGYLVENFQELDERLYMQLHHVDDELDMLIRLNAFQFSYNGKGDRSTRFNVSFNTCLNLYDSLIHRTYHNITLHKAIRLMSAC